MTAPSSQGDSASRSSFSVRPIEPADDPAVASLIIDVLREFDCDRPGFAIHDPEVRAMSAHYPGGPARYSVIEREGVVLGGGGFGPLAGSEPAAAICELRKMYFRPELRGSGLGRALLERLLAEMVEAGYRQCYLETTTQMQVAQRLYRSLGFTELDAPLGATGHGGCDRYFLLQL